MQSLSMEVTGSIYNRPTYEFFWNTVALMKLDEDIIKMPEMTKLQLTKNTSR